MIQGATTQPGQTQPGQDTTWTGHNLDRHNPDAGQTQISCVSLKARGVVTDW